MNAAQVTADESSQLHGLCVMCCLTSGEGWKRRCTVCVCFYDTVLTAGLTQLGPHNVQNVPMSELLPLPSSLPPLGQQYCIRCKTANKTSIPILPPMVEQLLPAFSDPIGFEGRAGGRVELQWDYPSLGFWLGLRQNPGELSGLGCACVCVCCGCAGEGKYSSVHLPLPPKGNSQEG